MKTISINYYSFNELSPEQQKKVLKKYSTHFVEHDWWNLTIECVNEILETLFNTKSDEIYFSTDRANFCSYEISVDIKDILDLIKSNKIQENYPHLQEFLEDEINSIKECYFFEREKMFNVVYDDLKKSYFKTKHGNNCFYIYNTPYSACSHENVNENLDKLNDSIESFLEKLSEYFLGIFKNEEIYLMSDEYIKETFISEDTHFNENDLSIFK